MTVNDIAKSGCKTNGGDVDDYGDDNGKYDNNHDYK